ncbi:type IV secretory system conjugative DNA transfer family protein [Micromonospora sp. URMC 105]|uniref:type IV secretory system conjugative DNA transfer family protein n=1 Tax=Micromonospora sp. URMC 105 TaxID=3423413 RepID=UPI003F19687B
MQMDFVPSAITFSHDMWRPSEPLSWRTGRVERFAALSFLRQQVAAFGATRTKIDADLIDFQNLRLEQILSFLDKASVNLCVFPEYAFLADPSTLQLFSGFAPRMTIVAGIGLPRSGGVEALSEYSADPVSPNHNVVAVFSGEDCHLVTKQHAAEGESITPGSGYRSIELECGGRKIVLGVVVCKDYLVAGPSLGGVGPVPDVLAIPAYTSNLAAFRPEAPRDFPRILANSAENGGSTIYAAGCDDRFASQGVPQPIPAQAEGIISVKWHGPPERPTSLLKPRNRVVLRSAMLPASDDESAIKIAQAFQRLAQSGSDGLDEAGEFPRWMDYLEGKPRLALLADAVRLYWQAKSDDLVTPDLAEQLSRHLVSQETPSFEEHWHRALDRVIKQLKAAVSAHSDKIDLWRTLLSVLEQYLLVRGAGNEATYGVEQDDPVEDKLVRHFSIGLGQFDSKNALATLSDQQDLLQTFARSAPDKSRLSYRLETRQDPATGNVFPHFCADFYGPAGEEADRYFTSLQRISRSVYLRGWSTYTAGPASITGHRVAIVPRSGTYPKIREDLGFLVDVLRATGGNCMLEISGRRVKQETDDLTSKLPGSLTIVESAAGEGAKWFAMQAVGGISLGLEVTLVTPERNDPLANLIGAALFSGSAFDVVELHADAQPEPVVYPVEVAHRIMHPPHGYIEGRGLGSRRPLLLTVRGWTGVGEGAVLGTARAARPFVDDDLEVRIPDASRLLHTYVIGRTGVGKTNTLKNLARHDLTRHDQSRQAPVIIIDPHGELFDYAVRHATHRDNLIALDFSKPAVPSINPIYMDATDEDGILRNVESLIEMVVGSMYYEWAGPRFSDLMRLCLQTLVAVANEDAGKWAEFGDILALIEDRKRRTETISTLRRYGRTELVQRWEMHERMKREEQAEVEQWFISKFGDFRRPGPLVEATRGKPSVNLAESLRDGAAVLVKVPRTTLGTGASQFLGSLIVDRVLRYTMEGDFLGFDEPASIIVDEFQNFVGTSFTTLIPEARKFNLGITVANQTLSQLTAFAAREGHVSDSLSQVVLGNVGNMIVQGVGRHDADLIGPEVGISSADLTRIGKYQAVVLLTVNGERLEPFTVRMSDSDERPGVAAGAVAAARADDALKRAGEQVRVPVVRRPSMQERAAASTMPTAPAQRPPSSFLDEWMAKRARKEAPITASGNDEGEDMDLDSLDERTSESNDDRPSDLPDPRSAM